jgi:hypothetical protein
MHKNYHVPCFLNVMKQMSLLILFVFAFQQGDCTVRTAVANGDWDNSSTWSPGAMPTYGDTINIPAGRTVSVTSQQNYGTGAAMTLIINGNLFFTNGNKITLPCGSFFIIKPGGKVDDDNGGGNSNYIKICSDIVWDSGDPPVTGPSCLPANDPRCSGALLVELVHLSAKWDSEHAVIVSWITATEINNSYFEISRSSDARSYEVIGKVSGHGNSTVANTYSLTDDGISRVDDGYIYYLLKQVDYDGAFKYYGPISVRTSGNEIRFALYPNPVQGESVLHLILNQKESATFTLVDPLGRIVFSNVVTAASPGLPINFTLPEIPAGLYTAIVQTGGLATQKKLIIIN